MSITILTEHIKSCTSDITHSAIGFHKQ